MKLSDVSFLRIREKLFKVNVVFVVVLVLENKGVSYSLLASPSYTTTQAFLTSSHASISNQQQPDLIISVVQ